MIKFFRRIRYDLMEKTPTTSIATTGSKTGKPTWPAGRYFKYAIGEIILVVVGILIAIQINNWNENKISLKNEQLILKGLQQNFTFNLEELGNAINLLENSYNSSIQLLEMMGPKASNYTVLEVDSLLSNILNYGTYDPATGVVDEVINSGKLNIIQNEELKNQISDWSRLLVDSHKDEEILNYNLFNVLIIYLNDKSNYRNYPIPEYLLKATRLKEVSPSKFNPDYSKIMTSLEFENILYAHSSNLMYTISEYIIIQNYLKNINELISSQIK